MELRERSERSVSLKPVQAMSFHTRIKYTTWQIEKRKNICVTKDCWHKHNRCFMFELRCLRNHDCLHVLIQHKYMSAEMMEIWKGWVWVTNVARQFELVWWLRLSLSQWQAGSSDSDWTFDSCVPIWEARLTWSGHRADSTCLKNHPSVSANRRQPWFDLDRPIGKQDTSTILRIYLFWKKKKVLFWFCSSSSPKLYCLECFCTDCQEKQGLVITFLQWSSNNEGYCRRNTSNKKKLTQ